MAMTDSGTKHGPRENDLPDWAVELIALYESKASSQFILYGNVEDRLLLPGDDSVELGNLADFLMCVMLPRFDVVLSYDLGNGIRIEKGGEVFAQWPHFKENPQLPKSPRAAVEILTHYFRYCGNLRRLKGLRLQIGCIVKAAHLAIPAFPGGLSYDLNAIALLIREWTAESLLSEHPLVTFLITENLNDLHPLLVNNPRASHIKLPLPGRDDLKHCLEALTPRYRVALGEAAANFDRYAEQLCGTTLSAIEGLLRTREYQRRGLGADDLVKIKKSLVEKECSGLIEFIESKRTLDDFHGQEKTKNWLRQDIALWNRNDLAALPMGYLLCGPVGTGKTFLVECLAGEAGVPVVKLKNFRDKWVGSTEGNLEKIFRLLQALGRCFVFIDEADQALGRRDSDSGDSNVSGRIYAMIAQEMGNTANRGRIVWILASSRPDLIEIDLKRPGRIDVKIPIFPATSALEGFQLIAALCRRRGMDIQPSHFAAVESLIPSGLTPGAAEALAVKVYRYHRTQSQSLEIIDVLRDCLVDYQNPVPSDVMNFQIQLAIREASDLDFVPPALLAWARDAEHYK